MPQESIGEKIGNAAFAIQTDIESLQRRMDPAKADEVQEIKENLARSFVKLYDYIEPLKTKIEVNDHTDPDN